MSHTRVGVGVGSYKLTREEGKSIPDIIKDKLGLQPGDLVFMALKKDLKVLSKPPESVDDLVAFRGHSALWMDGAKNLAHIVFTKGSFTTGGAALTGLPMTDTYAIFRCKRRELAGKVSGLAHRIVTRAIKTDMAGVHDAYPDYMDVEIIRRKLQKLEDELKEFSEKNRSSLETTPLFERLYADTDIVEINGKMCLPLWKGAASTWIDKQKQVAARAGTSVDEFEIRQNKYNMLGGTLTKFLFVDECDLDVPDGFGEEDVRRALKFASRFEEASFTHVAGLRCSEFVIAMFHSAAFQEYTIPSSRSFKEFQGKPVEEYIDQLTRGGASSRLSEVVRDSGEGIDKWLPFLPRSMIMGSKFVRSDYLARKISKDPEFEYIGYFDIIEKGVLICYPDGATEFVTN